MCVCVCVCVDRVGSYCFWWFLEEFLCDDWIPPPPVFLSVFAVFFLFASLSPFAVLSLDLSSPLYTHHRHTSSCILRQSLV